MSDFHTFRRPDGLYYGHGAYEPKPVSAPSRMTFYAVALSIIAGWIGVGAFVFAVMK